jgi:hypothetical protein
MPLMRMKRTIIRMKTFPPEPKPRRDLLADGFAGEAIRDELLQVVADFDFELSILHGSKHQQAIVLSGLTDAFAAVSEHPLGVLINVLSLERVDGRDNNDIAGRFLQRADQRFQLTLAVRIDHVREVVDRTGELRRLRLRPCTRRRKEHKEKQPQSGHTSERAVATHARYRPLARGVRLRRGTVGTGEPNQRR